MVTGVLFLMLVLLALLLAAFIYQIVTTTVDRRRRAHAHQVRGGAIRTGPGAASQPETATRRHRPCCHRAGT